jgi:hypothetical protein
VLWSFCGNSFLAKEARKHGFLPKYLTQKALVCFGALELLWLFFSRHGNTETPDLSTFSMVQNIINDNQ